MRPSQEFWLRVARNDLEQVREQDVVALTPAGLSHMAGARTSSFASCCSSSPTWRR
ncbi:hypothetical protein [Streptacidiphilus sp. EB129]|uniref:hypothetical protein n=1 Tax=Streptacidiphilus sp. EB129 TaxID=3156262 RepID=UPI003516F40F